MTNSTENFPKESLEELPYPLCIPKNTFGVTQFWAEEYWALCQIKKLRKKYPRLDFQGILNNNFENYLPKILNTAPHTNILNTKSFGEIPKNSWKMSNKLINLATSHAPSRYKAAKFLLKYRDSLGIITFDAHLDLGDYTGIHGAWISKNLAKRVTMIGGWADPKEELARGAKSFRYLHNNLDTLKEETSFLDWIERKKVYLTIDLDFFQPISEYLGLSCFWHRNLFIGHSLNLNQQIQLLHNPINSSTIALLGKELNIFDDLQSFLKLKLKVVEAQIQELICLVGEISQLLQATNSSLVGMDLVEYSAITDWEKITINALIQNFDLFEKKLFPNKEELNK